MSFVKDLEAEYLSAYKSHNEIKVAVLRMVKTAIKHTSIELRREPNDLEVLEIITKQVKQRKESIALYTQAGRKELAEREQAEMKILAQYLPAPLSAQELENAVNAAIDSIGASSMADMGAVMAQLTSEYKGQIDGKKASALVRSKLSS